MAVSQDEEAEDRYAKEKMAAAAGAPGSGEGGGEAEPDSEPISGEVRPAETAYVLKQLSPEKEADPPEGNESGHGGEGLRQPGEKECAGPVRKEGVLQASQWSHEPSGLAVQPSHMDTGHCRMEHSALLSTQEQEEPMQLGEDLHCPSSPCHGAPPPIDLAFMEAGGEMVHPSSIGDHTSLHAPADLEEMGSTLSSLQPMTEEPMDDSYPSSTLCFKGQPSRDPAFMEMDVEADGMTGLREVGNPLEEESLRPSLPLPTPLLWEPSSLPSSTPVLEELRSATTPTPVLQEQRSTTSPTPVVQAPSSSPSPIPILEELRSTTAPTPVLQEPSSSPSPTHVLQELRSTMSPTPVVQEPSSSPSPILVLEELRSTTALTPVLQEPSSAQSPTPILQQQRSTMSPTPLLREPSSLPSSTPVLEELRSTTTPTPVLHEQRSTTSPTSVVQAPSSSPSPIPILEELRSTTAPTPVLEEPRSTMSPTPVLQEPSSSTSPNPVLEELRATMSPTPVLEEPRSTMSPTPVLEEPRSTMSPTPVLEEPRSTMSPTPVLEEPRSTMSPTPVLEEPRSTMSPTPVLEEPRSTMSPTPVLEEPRSTMSPTPVLEEPRSTMSPTPVLEEPRSTMSSTPVLQEPSSSPFLTPVLQELSHTHVLEELRSMSPTPVLEEPRFTPSPTLVFEELRPTSSPTPVFEEARSTSSPTPFLEELRSTSSPTPVVEELRSTSSPTPVLGELGSTSSPIPVLGELRSTSSPTPVLEELRSTSSPTPVLEELRSTSSPTPVLEELRSTSSPTPVLEELRSTSSPTPVLEELRSTSSPTPVLEEPRSMSSLTSDHKEPRSLLSFTTDLEQQKAELSSTSDLEEPRSTVSLSTDLEELRSSTSPHLQTLFEQCSSDPVFEDIPVTQALDLTQFRQTSVLENILQDSQETRSPEVQCLEHSPSVTSLLHTITEEVSAVQGKCSAEMMNIQGPISEVISQVQAEPMEVALLHEPAPEVMCRVQEPVLEVMHALAPEVVPLMKDNSQEILEPVSEFLLYGPVPACTVVGSEPDMAMHLSVKPPIEHVIPGSVSHLSDSVSEIRDSKAVAKTETVFNSVHEPIREDLDIFEGKMECVPEQLHLKLQHELNTVSVEEKVLALGVAEINQGVHPVTEQCTELGVEVKLFLQPVLQTFEEGPNNKDSNSGFHLVSHRTELKSDETSLQVVSKVKSVLKPGNIETPCKVALVDSETSADSVVAAELKPLENELDSNCICFHTEPSIEHNSECTEKASITGDAECDPFYRDANKEHKSVHNTDPIMVSDPELEHQQVSRIASDAAQLNVCSEWCLEEPMRSPTDPAMEACLDNHEQYKSPLAAQEQFVAVGGIADLSPGSEVQVTLDHIIQDALVVSFRHGDRIFSGVLMDLSKRFGPHGIPVTVHPKREYKNKPEEPIQVQSTSFQEDSKTETNENGTADAPPVQSSEPCGLQNLWTSKPPPLFHEGAPYPPPLFIRDTYNQSIPQPPPRKIKRLKKKIYREEPTSIMNAIKLRPRQVLCDKCKNVVADKKEVRKTGTDSFKLEEGKRRRHESVTTVNKKLKTDHKVNGKSQNESQKRNSVSKVSNLGRGKVVKVASQTNTTRAQLHTKKVLQSKNMDHAKAREVLKMAKVKAQKKQKDASSSKNSHSKVHFTRRLQNTSSGTLPPRLRIKPQRYRNEENDSSLKIGLDSLRSSKMGIKPQTSQAATRSAGEAPSNGPQEASSDIQNTSVCVPPGEQDEQPALSKRGSKSNITVYMTVNQTKTDSSSASVCSSDSTDDLKSTHSECSSTENFDFPPGSMHAPSSSSSSSSKEEKKLSNSLKIKMFSKNVSKCVTPDGRTICVGDIVWAKIYGFPWWPARILTITISRKDNGLLMRQEARISWFGSPTTSFLALSQLSPFLENFQSRFNKKRKGLYRKAITEAAKAAKQLTPEVRALLTQFET